MPCGRMFQSVITTDAFHARHLLILLTSLLTTATFSFGQGQNLAPRSAVIKPLQTVVDQHQDPARITVKFRDGLNIRLNPANNSSLTDFGTGTLAAAGPVLSRVRGGVWRATYPSPEAELNRWRHVAEAKLQRHLADLNLQFILTLPPGIKAGEAIDLFNRLDVVEIALPVPKPVLPPLPPNYQGNQVYLNAATSGIDALGMWNNHNTTGAGIKIADIEYSWNLSHQDLPAVTLIGPSPIDPFGNPNHGTAVLGTIASISNGWGTTGVSQGSQIHVVAANTAGGYNVAGAITTAMSVLGPGDVLLIEQQLLGPTGNYVPVEWYAPNYNAIVTAVGNGIIVIEPAGNGGENLDAAIYSTGNGGHWPFLAGNDSGAMIIGAGAAPPGFGSTTDRSRLPFSTYGSTVDLQGWGESVTTTGFGGLYSAEGVNLLYTIEFNGTSSASAIIAGAAALLQSRKKSTTGSAFTPALAKSWLRQTGSPQQSGTYPATQNIGPRPNLTAAVLAAGLAQTNDLCANATSKSVGSHAFSTIGAETDGPDEPNACAQGSNTQILRDVWFKHISPCTGTTTISLCGSSFDTKVAIYNGCPTGPGQSIACNDDSGTCPPFSQVSFNSQAGTVYRIRIGSPNSSSGTGTMSIACTPAPPPCPADTNNDGQVNVTDLLAVITAFGPCTGCPADINHDGVVNVADLLAVIAAFGPCG